MEVDGGKMEEDLAAAMATETRGHRHRQPPLPLPHRRRPTRPRLPSSRLAGGGNEKLDDGIPAVGGITRPTGFLIFPGTVFFWVKWERGFPPRRGYRRASQSGLCD